MTSHEDESNTEAAMDFREVEITREPIELYKVLKFESMVGSGGEAKAAIAAGVVFVNGEVETQKRKKMVSGDTIEFGDENIRLLLNSSPSDIASPEEVAVIPARKKKMANRKPIPIVKGSNKK